MLKSLLPKEVKIKFAIDDMKLRSNSNIKEATKVCEKSFFYTMLSLSQSHFCPLRSSTKYHPKISAIIKSEKPIVITGIEKVHRKCDCIDRSKVNGVREPILYSFAHDKPPALKIEKIT